MAHIGEELRFVLARLFKLPALVLNFVELPHILDGDHGLVGEGRYKLDFLGRKWLRHVSADGHDADAVSFSEQRDAEQCTVAAKWLGTVTVFRVGENIRNVHHPGLQCDTSGNVISAGGNRMLPYIFFQLRRQAVASRNAIDVAITKENDVV